MACGPATTEQTRRPEVILHSLVGHREWVSADAQVEAVHQHLMESGRDFVAVMEGEELVGLCSQTALGMLLGQRYGYALFARRPIQHHCLPKFLTVSEATAIQEVLPRVFQRPADELYDDVALLSREGRFLGLIPVRSLVTLQNRTLMEKLQEGERQERDLRAKNRELELLARKLNDTNEELATASQLAMEATRQKSEFLANMSHEIRTPMKG